MRVRMMRKRKTEVDMRGHSAGKLITHRVRFGLISIVCIRASSFSVMKPRLSVSRIPVQLGARVKSGEAITCWPNTKHDCPHRRLPSTSSPCLHALYRAI